MLVTGPIPDVSRNKLGNARPSVRLQCKLQTECTAGSLSTLMVADTELYLSKHSNCDLFHCSTRCIGCQMIHQIITTFLRHRQERRKDGAKGPLEPPLNYRQKKFPLAFKNSF